MIFGKYINRYYLKNAPVLLLGLLALLMVDYIQTGLVTGQNLLVGELTPSAVGIVRAVGFATGGQITILIALAIVVMADPLASDVWIEDAAIASIMIQLQAEDLGLGSCWVQVRERFTATGMPSGEYVHEVLDIPLQLQVVSIIAVGHKGMERKPFNEEHLQWEKVHINKYGGK